MVQVDKATEEESDSVLNTVGTVNPHPTVLTPKVPDTLSRLQSCQNGWVAGMIVENCVERRFKRRFGV